MEEKDIIQAFTTMETIEDALETKYELDGRQVFTDEIYIEGDCIRVRVEEPSLCMCCSGDITIEYVSLKEILEIINR